MQSQSRLQQRVALWEKRAEEHETQQHSNVFSSSYQPTAALPELGSAEYGRPVEGTLTDLRGKQAAHWVDDEVDRLVENIKLVGRLDEQGRTYCTFGEIFAHYVDISNTVVGIIMRARKRNRIEYEGEMLYQNKSEHVVIVVI